MRACDEADGGHLRSSMARALEFRSDLMRHMPLCYAYGMQVMLYALCSQACECETETYCNGAPPGDNPRAAWLERSSVWVRIKHD